MGFLATYGLYFALAVVSYVIYKIAFKTKSQIPADLANFKEVPKVTEDWVPFAGHGLAFGKDIPGFIKDKFLKYGPVFRIKVFLTDLVVICDRTLIAKYFQWRESEASLYDVLDRLYFADAFADDPKTLPIIITLIKTTITVNTETFLPKIQQQAERMIERLKQKTGQIKLSKEMIRFVAFTSAHCFTNIELTESFYESLIKFTDFLNVVVKLTYFFPKWLLRLVLNPTLTKYRKQMTRALEPEIRTYRDNLDKCDSLVFRRCVDYVVPETGKTLSDQDIGDIVVTLLYVSSENTALGLSATVTDLAAHPQWWQKVKGEAHRYLASGKVDLKGLFSSRVVDDCVMESARLNSHVFAINRQPKNNRMTLGEYYVGDAMSVVLCEPMLMKTPECAGDVFAQADKYNPDRYNATQMAAAEPKTPMNVMTWGAGVHLCPGKAFAVYEIKTAMALMTLNFDVKLPDVMPPLDYFSPSAFAERQFKVTLTEASPFVPDVQTAIPTATNAVKKYTTFDGRPIVRYTTPDGNSGWLLSEFLDNDQQSDMYKYTVDLSRGTPEHQEILTAPVNKAYPITYHRLVYTNQSNCATPQRWFNTACQAWATLQQPDNDFVTPMPNFDSLYAQLFTSEGSMALHRDEYVNWGVSINLGASCEFVFGKDIITLHSGDVFVADFSRVTHGVKSVLNNPPGWFSVESLGDDTFGRTRCSIQIRNVSECMPKEDDLMSMTAFKDMVTGTNV